MNVLKLAMGFQKEKVEKISPTFFQRLFECFRAIDENFAKLGLEGGPETAISHASLSGLGANDHIQYAQWNAINLPHTHSRFNIPDLPPNQSEFIIAGQVFGD